MNGYSAEQVRAAEAPHLAAGEPLMMIAAAGLADAIRDVLHDREADAGASILVLVGTGNNGGDALFAGAELAREGADVVLLPVGERMHAEGREAALAAGARIRRPGEALAGLAKVAARADVIVDGILGTGTGASPALRGTAREVVAAILPALRGRRRPAVIAVDIPSGVSPDDGSVPDPTVLPADVTVTFGGVKAGLLLPPASRLAGRVRLVDIGLGPELARMEPLLIAPDTAE
ncbi:NAD(P)H-hydrate epimerase [Planctomonas deserti]|uniref:NAD(P)H-hydrate epimerase n=1 Tax=Planctomonas deserti TaxID=2144185 RepID=UPI000D369B5A|nr:NAD(P)H-hydrate epimerase [Planctomonas deserti]